MLSVKNDKINSNVAFGTLSKDAKAVINRPEIRTILKRRYNIDKADIKKLDESRLKFDLLSSQRSLESLNLSDVVGLFLIPFKGVNLPKTCISVADTSIKRGNEFFAYCVKKAVEMEKIYRKTVIQFSSHSVNKKWSGEISKQERPLKIHLKNYTNAYNSGDVAEMDKLSTVFKKVEKAELAIDDIYKSERELVQADLENLVVNGWGKINMEIPPRYLRATR